jgi:tripartite-type tricarboxylate transporter receptor subunit TctC
MSTIPGKVSIGALIVCSIAWGLGLVFAPPSHAQDYPNKPIRVVIAGGAGSSPEIIARLLGNKMLASLGRPFVMDPRPGASGGIGAEAAAKAAPDGYTLFMLTSQLSSAAAMYTKLRYNLVEDFAPISLVGTTPSVLVVNPSLPAGTLAELLALVRPRPGTLMYGSAGVGSSSHLPAVLFAAMAKVDMLHVPYKDSPGALLGTMTGEVGLSFQPLTACLPMVRSGKLKALGVTGATRTALAPDLPTIAQTVPGFEYMLWQGIVAPAKTPPAIIAKLNAEVVKALNSPDVREQMAAIGNEPLPSTPEAYARHITEQVEKMKEIVRLGGIKPQD